MVKARSEIRRWRRWTEKQARGALAELESTGESASSFARRKGISAQRIAWWRRRLGQAGTTEFVAVALPTAAEARWIEIKAMDVIVRIREELDADHVARLVEAIGRRMGNSC